MFSESSESELEKWVQSIERRGFHCELGMRINTLLFTHPIRVVIQDQNLQFVGEGKGEVAKKGRNPISV